MRLVDYCSHLSMETIFMNTDNRKINKPHKRLNLSQRLGLRSSNKHVTLQKLSVYFIRGKI